MEEVNNHKSRLDIMRLSSLLCTTLLTCSGVSWAALANEFPTQPLEVESNQINTNPKSPAYRATRPADEPEVAPYTPPNPEDRITLEGEPQFEISSVYVRGNQRIEEATVLSYLGLDRGDVVTRADVNEALKQLFATGFFADATIEFYGTQMVIEVVENPTINDVKFEGNEHIDDEKLVGEVRLKPRSIFTRTKLQSDLNRLLERYRREGRFSATVQPNVETYDQNRLDLIYEIEEGDVTRITDVTFIGNKAFASPTLREVVRTSQECWYCFLSDNDKYNADMLEFDKELLRKFYTSQGYADFKLDSVIAELSPDKKELYITFTMDEGTKYDFGNISVASNLQGRAQEGLDDIPSSETGSFYNTNDVEDSIDSLTKAMEERGFAFVKIEPELKRNITDQTIDITYNIKGGPRVYVERIDIVGNRRTLDEVVRREFRLAEGDPFNAAKLRRSEERLRNLGFFDSVNLKRKPGSSPDRVVVEVQIEERSTGELSLGAGFSSTDGALADIGIRERNLLGSGQDLRFKGTFATRRQQFDIGFTEPYFLDRELSVGFDLFKTTQDFNSESSFDRESLGGRLRAGYAISEHLKHSLYYSYEEIDITDVDDDASTFIQEQEGSNVTSLVGHALTWDRRNNRFDPSEGFMVRFSQDYAGVGGDSEFIRHELGASYYYPIHDQWTFMLSGNGGSIIGVNDDDVRINDRFFLGGRKLRGFDNAGVGPRDTSTTDALGGNTYYTGTAEMTFPLGLPEDLGFKGAIFADAGSLFDLDSSGSDIVDTRSVRAAGGVGLLWKSPFGPIRLDFAKAFRKEDFDETETFRFNFGSRF